MTERPDAGPPVDQPDVTDPSNSGAEARLEREREALLGSVTSGQGGTVLHRVAIVLNRFPEARDSDVKLMLRFWEMFEGYTGGSIDPAELFERSRQMTLTRARARVQNTFKLFQASAAVRKQRGKLSEEERIKAIEATERYPGSTVLIDESGKSGGANLIVGAVWFSDPEDLFVVTRKLLEWRNHTGFTAELHFKELNDSVEPAYREALDLIIRESASVSFKAVSVPREGIKRIDEALAELMYQLLRRGVQHEHDSGRARLPRALQVWKDLESKGADKILLAQLKDRLQQAGKVELDNQLGTDEFLSIESNHSDLMQIADLFSGSLNRVLNAPGGEKTKDRFAAYLLEQVGMPGGPSGETTFEQDAVMHFQL